MDNALEKIQIDFQILDTGDPRVLMIADNSVWGRIDNKTKIIEIVLPGGDPSKDGDVVTHYYQAHQINAFNSFSLGITCDTTCDAEYMNLPDGVYTITVKGSPDTYKLTKLWLKTDNTQLELDKLFITYYNACGENNKCFKDLIFDIQMLLDGARASVRFSDVCKGQELLYRAQELIERVRRCKKC